MDEFTNQIKRAAEPGVDLIIMGNANLDSNKWNDPKFIHANIANDLFQVIDQYGIKIEEVYYYYPDTTTPLAVKSKLS